MKVRNGVWSLKRLNGHLAAMLSDSLPDIVMYKCINFMKSSQIAKKLYYFPDDKSNKLA